MFVYRITFVGGSVIDVRANSPKEAWERAEKMYWTMQVSSIRTLR